MKFSVTKLCLGWCLLFCFSGSAWAAASAVIEAVGGSDTVKVQRAGKSLRLRAGERLEAGDELVTGLNAAVDLRLEDKTLVRVGANSSYRLEAEDSHILHRLLSGILRVLVPKEPKEKGDAVRFRLTTPEGTIGVRGTEFVVLRTPGDTLLKTLEGEVLVGPVGAGFEKAAEFVRVDRGRESRVRAGGSPSAPKSFPLDSYLKTIDGARGPFGPLAARKGVVMKERGQARGTAPLAAAAAEAPGSKAMAIKKAKEEKADTQLKPLEEQLFEAAATGRLDLVKSLLEKGADVNARLDGGNTALHAAAVEGFSPVVKLLLARGADVNARNADGLTPLMVVARESGDAAVALVLLDNKADAALKDRAGRTALMIARRESGKSEAKKKEYADILLLLEGEESP